MLDIAIVGCGRIADAHASQIQRIQGCRIVAACDQEELMAKQLCERFHIKRFFSDLATLINELHPDVVHITTPPESHFELAQMALRGGCHVYVEKPFVLRNEEAEKLVDIAERTNQKLTVGHDHQYSHATMRMRSLVQKGYLGGPPVHLESYYCYDFGDATYAKALLSDKRHWVRRLPGGLLQNVISHGIARIAEYLDDDITDIFVLGFVSPLLRSIGEDEVIDELRVMIRDRKGVSAFFTFSSQIRPSINHFRIYGMQNSLFLDEDQQVLIKLHGKKYKSYAQMFVPPVNLSRQYIANWSENMRLFLRRDFHFESRKKYLFEAFYRSIRNDSAVPIPYREILLTSRIMDEIFVQLQNVGIS